MILTLLVIRASAPLLTNSNMRCPTLLMTLGVLPLYQILSPLSREGSFYHLSIRGTSQLHSDPHIPGFHTIKAMDKLVPGSPIRQD